MRRVAGILAGIFVALAGPIPSFAEISQIRVICAYPPGSGADITIRYYAAKLKEVSGATVIVENKSGANAHLGTLALMSAKPDGKTILIHSTGAVLGNPLMMETARYDPLQDLEVAALLFEGAFVLATRLEDAPHNVAGLVSAVQRKAGQAKFGSANSSSLVSTEMFLRARQLAAISVNYRASPDIVQDLRAGLLDFSFVDAAFGTIQARAHRIKLLATTGNWKIPGFPDVPTMHESGFHGYDYTLFFGVWLPKGTDKALVSQYYDWMKKIGSDPDTDKQLATAGAVNSSSLSPADVKATLKSTYEKWGSIVREAGIKLQ